MAERAPAMAERATGTAEGVTSMDKGASALEWLEGNDRESGPDVALHVGDRDGKIEAAR